jgi:hypothetical protein
MDEVEWVNEGTSQGALRCCWVARPGAEPNLHVGPPTAMHDRGTGRVREKAKATQLDRQGQEGGVLFFNQGAIELELSQPSL